MFMPVEVESHSYLFQRDGIWTSEEGDDLDLDTPIETLADLERHFHLNEPKTEPAHVPFRSLRRSRALE